MHGRWGGDVDRRVDLPFTLHIHRESDPWASGQVDYPRDGGDDEPYEARERPDELAGGCRAAP